MRPFLPSSPRFCAKIVAKTKKKEKKTQACYCRLSPCSSSAGIMLRLATADAKSPFRSQSGQIRVRREEFRAHLSERGTWRAFRIFSLFRFGGVGSGEKGGGVRAGGGGGFIVVFFL